MYNNFLFLNYIIMTQLNISSYSWVLDYERIIIAECWELIKRDVKLEADRILLPWFPNWLKLTDEPWLYKIEDAREAFWNRLPNADQFWELWEYIDSLKWNIDMEDIFHRVLGMQSFWNNPYFLESSQKWLLELLARSFWIKWKWYQLITANMFWPHMDKLWEKWIITEFWPITHIKVWTVWALEKDFKVRLQGN